MNFGGGGLRFEGMQIDDGVWEGAACLPVRRQVRYSVHKVHKVGVGPVSAVTKATNMQGKEGLEVVIN